MGREVSNNSHPKTSRLLLAARRYHRVQHRVHLLPQLMLTVATVEVHLRQLPIVKVNNTSIIRLTITNSSSNISHHPSNNTQVVQYLPQ